MLGEKIKELRTKKNISQKELADRLFVSDKTLSSWEINRTEPSLDLVVEICNILDVSVAKFLYEDNKSIGNHKRQELSGCKRTLY